MANGLVVAAFLLLTSFVSAQSTDSTTRPRVLELGLKVGILSSGPLDAITDVAGVEVGHTTIIRGDNIRTGVTAVLPHSGNLYREKVPGGVFVGNGFGKLTGSTQVDGLHRSTDLADKHNKRLASGRRADTLHTGFARKRGCPVRQSTSRRD